VALHDYYTGDVKAAAGDDDDAWNAATSSSSSSLRPDGAGRGGGTTYLDNNNNNNNDDNEEEEEMLTSRVAGDDHQDQKLALSSSSSSSLSHHPIIGSLELAKKAGERRALLCLDAKSGQVGVFADQQPILRTHQEHEQLSIVQKTVKHFHLILYPFVAVVLVVAYFQTAFDAQRKAPQLQAQNNQLSEKSRGGDDTDLILILAAVFFVAVILIVWLIYRFRAACERLFRKFLVVDILMIYLFGGASMILIGLVRLQILVGKDTFLLLSWNLACGGLASLYLKLPETLRRFYLVVLSAIMAVMMVITLPWVFLLIFLSLAALLDLGSGLHRRMRVLGDFISSDRDLIPFVTPRIFYEAPGLRFRFANLFTYGLLVGCTPVGTSVMFSTLTMIVAGLAYGLYILPYHQKRIRPLPLSMFGLVFFAYVHYPVIRPYARAINYLFPFDGSVTTTV